MLQLSDKVEYKREDGCDTRVIQNSNVPRRMRQAYMDCRGKISLCERNVVSVCIGAVPLCSFYEQMAKNSCPNINGIKQQ